jgi:hypothetical protein
MTYAQGKTAALPASFATAATTRTQAAGTFDAETFKVLKPFRIKLGAFFPTDGDVRDSLGDVFFSYGVSYDFLKTKTANPVIIGAYLDGYNKSKSGARINSIGIGPSLRYYFNPVVANPTRVYAGAGIGPYFINTKGNGNSENDTKLGGKVYGGVEFGPGFFGEVDYTLIGESHGVNPSGFNLSVGYRF